MKNHIVRIVEDNSTALVKALFPELLKDQIQKQPLYIEIT